MQKEILTIENIRYDLRKQIRGNIIAAVVLAVFFLMFGRLTIAVAEDGMRWYKSFFAILNTMLFSLLPILFFVGTIACIVEVCKLYAIHKKPGNIVKDRLVGKYTKEHLHRHHYYETLHLRFASYGEYPIPTVNYNWSELYAMDDSTLSMYADCDNVFYLVLSKPHTGKILLAYNTKMFDYQPPDEKSCDK